MRHAFTLLGIMTLVVSVGMFLAFTDYDTITPARDTISEEPMSLTLTSDAFENGGMIPSKYTCDGENVPPALIVRGVPEDTQSLVLVMDDPDIPQYVKDKFGIIKFDHWSLYNIPPQTNTISHDTTSGIPGLNSLGEMGYTGPCPPDTVHRYFFRLYALDTQLVFTETPTLDVVENALKNHVLGSTTLMGRYERTPQP